MKSSVSVAAASGNALVATKSPFRRHVLLYAVILGVCTLFILINTSAVYLNQQFGMVPPNNRWAWTMLLREQVVFWYPVALLVPLVIWAGQRFRLERQNWRRLLPMHLLLSLVFNAATNVLSLLLLLLLERETAALKEAAQFFVARTLTRIPISQILYWSILGASYAFDYARRLREQQLHAAQLQAQLVQAQLQALKMQLHPHFLFNTLHAISALMDEDVKAARRMIARLSELLRLTLDNAGQQEVPLRQELEVLERYLEIEQVRFQDRLRVAWQIEPAALETPVPNLLLQPLVENAIRHGIAALSTASQIEIRAMRQNGTLELQVRDDGPGLPAHAGDLAEGIGLANTRARLQQLYGDRQRLEITNAASGGVLVTITLPSEEVRG